MQIIANKLRQLIMTVREGLRLKSKDILKYKNFANVEKAEMR